MKFKNISILLLIILSASCSSGETTKIGFMPVASATVVIPSLTPTLLSTKTPTSTAIPTSTFSPIATVSVATLNAVSTLDAIRLDLINKFPELQEYSTGCFVTSCYGVASSSNGRWMIFTNGNTIELYRSDGEKVGNILSMISTAFLLIIMKVTLRQFTGQEMGDIYIYLLPPAVMAVLNHISDTEARLCASIWRMAHGRI